MPKIPWSSSGMKPAGMALPAGYGPRPRSRSGWSGAPGSGRRGCAVRHLVNAVERAKNLPSRPSSGRLQEHGGQGGGQGQGAEGRATEIAMVSANCWYMRPVSPGMKATGMNTAQRMRAMPMTGPIPLSWPGRWRRAGSAVFDVVDHRFHDDDRVVHHDMASTRPNMERVFTEKPRIGKKMKVPMRDTGTIRENDRGADVLGR